MNSETPTSSVDISAYHSILASALAQHEFEYLEFYAVNSKKHGAMIELLETLEERRMVLVLLASSLIEAVANVYLSLKLDTHEFEFLEMSSPLDKWTIVPGFFLPNYEFPKDGMLYQDLQSLFSRRNGITHMKPEVKRDGKRIHRGNHPPLSESEHKQMLRWLSLPGRLLDHLTKYDNKPPGSTWLASIEIDLMRGKERVMRVRRKPS